MASPETNPGMVIVGTGECGARAAFALREQGYEGPVTLIGEELHLPYERPPLSKDAMVSDADPSAKIVTDLQKLADAHIVLMSGTRVVQLDQEAHEVHLDNGASVPYAKLLLATGASPRRLRIFQQARAA